MNPLFEPTRGPADEPDFEPTRPMAAASPPATAFPDDDDADPRYPLSIAFTGSGSEYFRIWIVNLLLLIVTVGIYYPWAKVRRLRYFHGNTLVDGEAMGFHGKPTKMLKGYLLVGLLFVLYTVAGQFSPMAGLAAFLIVMALWPALLKSSMQFRLANTSWRGMRFGFRGSLGGAYRAVLPLFVPSLIVVVALAFVVNPEKPPIWYLKTVGVVSVLGMVFVPWLMINLKQYQHNHYGLATLRTSFHATVSSFYNLFFKLFGVTILPMLLSIVLVTVVVFSGTKAGLEGRGVKLMMGLGVLSFFISFMSVFVVIKPYFTARLQNLVWNNTYNRTIRFASDLRFKSLLWLTVKNWLLIVLTCGLYWPFAAVAMARMRLQAVSVTLAESPEALVSHAQSAEGEAAGDAAGDLFGLDIGF